MTLTRADAEHALVDATKDVLAALELDVVPSGSNPDLNDVLAYTLLDMGYAPASLGAVQDPDLAAVPGYRAAEFEARARLRLKRKLATRARVLVDQGAANAPTNLSDIAKGLWQEIAVEQAWLDGFVAATYGAVIAPIAGPRADPLGLPQGWGECP